jgi:glycerol-3-phosphate cytidylyltransferase
MKRVLTHGTFDVPHLGHAIFLYRASKLGDYLMVGLSSDKYAESQGKKMVYSFKERKALLEQLPFVDFVYENNLASMQGSIMAYSPNIVVIGSDWGDRYFKQIDCTPQWLASHDVVLTYLPYTQEISTSDIKKRCK